MTTVIPEQPVESPDVQDAAVPAPDATAGEASSSPAPPIADGVERPLDPRASRSTGSSAGSSPARSRSALLVALLLILSSWRPFRAGRRRCSSCSGRPSRWPSPGSRTAGPRSSTATPPTRSTAGASRSAGASIWRKVINVPRSRVQHTDVSQGPLERGHGLGTLVIYTAGTDHARVDLPGLDHATALRIRDSPRCAGGGATMPSEQRLHPLSILFSLAAQVRALRPAGAPRPGRRLGAGGWGWQVWLMPLLIPYRARLGRRILLVPLPLRGARDGDPDAGSSSATSGTSPTRASRTSTPSRTSSTACSDVVEVRVETGRRQEPEATMSVLPVAAYEEMRRRVFASGAEARAGAEDRRGRRRRRAEQTLLSLPPRELMLSGLIQNRGFVVLAAAFGLLWELGLLDRSMGRIFGGRRSRGAAWCARLVAALLGRGGLPWAGSRSPLAAFAGLLLLSAADLHGLGAPPALRLPAHPGGRGSPHRVRAPHSGRRPRSPCAGSRR